MSLECGGPAAVFPTDTLPRMNLLAPNIGLMPNFISNKARNLLS